MRAAGVAQAPLKTKPYPLSHLSPFLLPRNWEFSTWERHWLSNSNLVHCCRTRHPWGSQSLQGKIITPLEQAGSLTLWGPQSSISDPEAAIKYPWGARRDLQPAKKVTFPGLSFLTCLHLSCFLRIAVSYLKKGSYMEEPLPGVHSSLSGALSLHSPWCGPHTEASPELS